MWKLLQPSFNVSPSIRTAGTSPLLAAKSGRYSTFKLTPKGQKTFAASTNRRTFSTNSKSSHDAFIKPDEAKPILDPHHIFEDVPEAKKQPLVVRTKNWFSTLPATVLHELRHYWNGSKQLGRDMVKAAGLSLKVTTGKKITRREKRFLFQAQNDLKMLGPFIVIVIVPFMEFALPVLLKLFPNMLPSPFIDKVQKEKNLMTMNMKRLKMSRIIQDAIYFRVVNKKNQTGIDFLPLMNKIRTGEPVSNAEYLDLYRSFKDEFSIDKLSKAELIAICRYFDLPTYGGVALMKMALNKKIQDIQKDDQLIREEGINGLTLEELQTALRDRGLRAVNDTVPVLKRRLAEWLDLSLVHKLPAQVLVMTRAIAFAENEAHEATLQEHLAYLTPERVEQVINTNPDVGLDYLIQKASDLRLKMAQEETHDEKPTKNSVAGDKGGQFLIPPLNNEGEAPQINVAHISTPAVVPGLNHTKASRTRPEDS